MHLLLETDMSHRSAHLTAEKPVFVRHTGKELPFLSGAVMSLQRLLCGFYIHFSCFLCFTLSNGGVHVPGLSAVRGRSPAGGLPDLAPGIVALLHLTFAAAAAARWAEVWRGAGGRSGLCLAVLSGTVRLRFALIVLIVTSQPVNGVVRICSRHPRLHVLTSTDHHWPEGERESLLERSHYTERAQWWRWLQP